MLNWFDHNLYEINSTSALLFFPSSVLRDGG